MNRYSKEYRNMTYEQRFWALVDKTDTCWIWQGKLSFDGYGTMKVEGTTLRMHRFSYEMAKGKIPDGLQIDHLCRNRACMNPDHLEAVESRVNTLRGNTLAARESAQTHCIHGHPLSGDNLRMSKSGKRVCRICAKTKAKLWRESRKKQNAFGMSEAEYKPSQEA